MMDRRKDIGYDEYSNNLYRMNNRDQYHISNNTSPVRISYSTDHSTDTHLSSLPLLDNKNGHYRYNPYNPYTSDIKRSNSNTHNDMYKYAIDANNILKDRILSKDMILSSSIQNQQKVQHNLNRSIRTKKSLASSRDVFIDMKSPDNYRQQNTQSTGLMNTGLNTNIYSDDSIHTPLTNNKKSLEIDMNTFLGGRPRLPTVNKNTFFKFSNITKEKNINDGLPTDAFDALMDRDGYDKSSKMVLRDNKYTSSKQLHQLSRDALMEKKDSTLGNRESIKIEWNNMNMEKVDLPLEFKLDKVLGKGNSSTVHRAYDMKLNRTVAVKILEKSSVKESYLRDMLQKEIDISIQFDHPNLAKLLRVLQDSVRVYLVQEYCGMHTLSQYTDNRKLSENKIRHIFKQIANGVNYMHSKGYAHRDLKFSNIILNEFGVVKLVDFGFACEVNRRQKIFCGTPSYMPPELVKKKDYYAGPVDMWCMGVILYKLATNDYPFGACNDKSLDKNIESCKYTQKYSLPLDIRNLIDMMIKYSPRDRLLSDELFRCPWLHPSAHAQK